MTKNPLKANKKPQWEDTRFRDIVADPNGNREQRRAAAKLAKKKGKGDGRV